MAASVFVLNFLSRSRFMDSFRGLVFIPTSLAFLTSLFIFYYISSTSRLLYNLNTTHNNRIHVIQTFGVATKPLHTIKPIVQYSPPKRTKSSVNLEVRFSNGSVEVGEAPDGSFVEGSQEIDQTQSSKVSTDHGSNIGNIHVNNNNNNNDVFHDRDIFHENYKEMKRSLKIFVYPHRRDDPFANVLLPVSSEPGGNYASESYFKKALMKSHFITKDPSKADFFFLPFSIASMRHDRRIGVGGIPDFVKNYIFNISHNYPHWNKTGGTDHFYVACHSIGKIAMDKAVEVKANAIQVVCSSNYFVNGYVAHKDVSLPQIWPRQGNPPLVQPSKRKRLAFFAGAINSPVRKELIRVWRNDSEIFAHFGRLKTPYSTELLRSKFCLHAKGFEVNTARIGDAIYYGCVPVILADHYDLPFEDILNWNSFSIVVSTLDIPLLKKILQDVNYEEYLRLQSNVLKVRAHFQWQTSPVEYDAFHMVMYELWLRRSYTRVNLAS